MQEPTKHREIGFADLFRIIFKKFYVIVIAVVVAAALGGLLRMRKTTESPITERKRITKFPFRPLYS